MVNKGALSLYSNAISTISRDEVRIELLPAVHVAQTLARQCPLAYPRQTTCCVSPMFGEFGSGHPVGLGRLGHWKVATSGLYGRG